MTNTADDIVDLVAPGSPTFGDERRARYIAPELFNPPHFDLPNFILSKESDVYSFAMTTYEVRSSNIAHGHRLYYHFPQDSYGDGTI